MIVIEIFDRKYLFLLLLYTLQFVPLGFFYGAIPAILGSNGVSFDIIGWVYLLGLLWVFKFIWARYIDNIKLPFFDGHYRSWLMVVQVLLSFCMFICSYFPLTQSFYISLFLIGIINFLSSTQDICVDGLAINSLRRDQLEYANSMQTIGTFIGSLIGLALPLYSYEIYDWSLSLQILSLIVLIPTFFLIFYKEKHKNEAIQRITFKQIYLFMKEKDGFKILLIMIPGYWIVERSFPLIQQLLIKNEWSLIDIVISQNILGSITGILAALIASSIINKFGKNRSYLIFSVFILLDVILMILLEDFIEKKAFVNFVLAYNYFCLGLFMTSYYTFIMSNSSKEYAGTHVNIQHGLLLFVSLLSTKVLFSLVELFSFKTSFMILGLVFVLTSIFIYIKRAKYE